MRVTAAEVMRREALPGQPPAGARPRPTNTPMAPAAPAEDPMMGGEDPNAAGMAPGPEDAAGAAQSNDMQQLTQSLLTDYFDDQKIADVSERIQKLIPLVGPEHAEKFTKVFSDWVKGAYVLKANLMSLAVMATPQEVMQNQVTQMMKQLTQQAGGQQGQQPLKVPVGPTT
jgi:hypothetical protein